MTSALQARTVQGSKATPRAYFYACWWLCPLAPIQAGLINRRILCALTVRSQYVQKCSGANKYSRTTKAIISFVWYILALIVWWWSRYGFQKADFFDCVGPPSSFKFLVCVSSASGGYWRHHFWRSRYSMHDFAVLFDFPRWLLAVQRWL